MNLILSVVAIMASLNSNVQTQSETTSNVELHSNGCKIFENVKPPSAITGVPTF